MLRFCFANFSNKIFIVCVLEKLKVEMEVEERNRLQNSLNCQLADAQKEV